jgi:hypothetical protein
MKKTKPTPVTMEKNTRNKNKTISTTGLMAEIIDWIIFNSTAII